MILKKDAIHSLCPSAGFSLSPNGEIIDWHNAEIAKPTEEAIQAKIAELTAAEPMRLLRIERNQLLTETDWRTLPDYPGSNQTEWQTYRQDLRDITTQSPALDENGNLTGITWPTPPND